MQMQWAVTSLASRVVSPRTLCTLARISNKIGLRPDELRSLTNVDLRAKALTADDLRIVAAELCKNGNLEHLDLAANGFGADGGVSCVDIIHANSAIASLVLDSNNLRAGASDISRALAGHTGLRHLRLAANTIGPMASVSVADAVAANTSLDSLDLGSNAFGYKGGLAIADALASSATSSQLRHLDLQACSVGPEAAVSLARAISSDHGHAIASLQMTTNFIGPEGVAAFAEALSDNTTLTSLSLSDNAIGQLGDRSSGTCGAALAAALEQNVTLRVLDLTFNGLSDAATETLTAAKQRSDGRRQTPLELRL